jgi:microcompartment protein CcmL/EutN
MYAIGVVETLSIPLGILAGDQMLKTADVSLVSAQTVCAGKYIVIVSGEVAAVRSAVSSGVESAVHGLVDSLVIPNVDLRVIRAMSGACDIQTVQAVGVVETFSLACAIQVADAAVKAADVELIEIRLGRGLGGKSFVVLTGEVAAVQAAVSAGERAENTQGLVVSSVVIPSPHMDMVRALM